jgi:hypothetical protein
MKFIATFYKILIIIKTFFKHGWYSSLLKCTFSLLSSICKDVWTLSAATRGASSSTINTNYPDLNKKQEWHQCYCAPRKRKTLGFSPMKKKSCSSCSCCQIPLYRLEHKYYIPCRWQLGWNLKINDVRFFLNWAQDANGRQCLSLVQKENKKYIAPACSVPHTLCWCYMSKQLHTS